ncbi:hypothetical protein Pint_30089 [Pistacia integerrima]|uniref:Uncharacterized protein n=1 Tax=Pistacia integerrima TaxID=434235 RepID=A0ACC0WZB2_9ROSI|nr:hypothetical protein Pint_30089 [Pistacia integerrima]
MSKTLLSRIKPVHSRKPTSLSPFRLTPRLKELVNETIEILKTHPQYDQLLENRFADEETQVSEVAHFVFDKIHDVELGVKFFDWLSKQPKSSSSLNEFACSSFLKLLARFRVFSEIELVLNSMRLEGIKPTHEALSFVVRAYACSGLVDKASELYDYVIELHNCGPDVFTCNSLLDLLVKCKKFKLARKLYDEMCKREDGLDNYTTCIMTYGAVLYGFCKDGNFKAIDKLLMEMKERGLTANVRVYNNIVDARIKHGFKVKVVETVQWMMDNGCEPDMVSINTLICGLCRDGRVEEASQLIKQAMERGLEPNKFSYTPIIHVCCKQGEYIRALNLLIEMTERGHKPDLVTYGALIHGLVTAGEADVAMTVRDKMMQRGVLPDAGIYNVLMSGLCKKGRLPAAKILLGEMLDHNILPDAFVYATLIDGFIRNGDLDEAKKLFELTIAKGMDPGVVGYNAMIKGYCKFGLMNDALSCLNKMTQKHHAPDEFTFSTIIDGYVKQHDLSSALRMFGKMVKQKCKPNVVTYTALINGFCRIGDSDRAERTFKAMQSCGLVPNVVTYTIIIGSFCKQGRVAKATSFFELMLMNKCIPNDVTFNYLVNGFTNNAPNVVSTNESEDDNKPIFLEFFGRMISDGWGHKAAAYNAILICLCCHGMVKTALQLHDKMVIKGFLQDPVSFAALLFGVCLEGRSKEWKNIIPCNLNEQELQIAVKYLQSLKQYLLRGMTSEVALCFHNLVEDLKSQDQKLDDYKGMRMNALNTLLSSDPTDGPEE